MEDPSELQLYPAVPEPVLGAQKRLRPVLPRKGPVTTLSSAKTLGS